MIKVMMVIIICKKNKIYRIFEIESSKKKFLNRIDKKTLNTIKRVCTNIICSIKCSKIFRHTIELLFI